MKSIVLVNQSSGYLTVDICNSFVKKYDEVKLIAGSVSSYPRTLNPKIEVIPICKYDKSNISKRLYTWIKGSIQIWRYIKGLDENVDVLYFTNPPMSYLWADKRNNKFAVVEYDIYPDALNNVKCPSFVTKWWAKRNRQIFKKSTGIITLGDGMRLQLSKYCSSEKIKVVHNWCADSEAEIVPEKDNKFVKAHNLKDKFVVIYSGNIGYTHNIETLIEVAECFNGNPKIAFVIIGDGGKKETLIKMTKDKGLKNVMFSDFLSAEDLKYSMSCANLGVVTLTKETAHVSVPSKTYNLLSYGIPLLNISPSNSELGKIIAETGCGESFEPNNIAAICDYVSGCASDKLKYEKYRSLAKRAGKMFTYFNADVYTEIFE